MKARDWLEGKEEHGNVHIIMVKHESLKCIDGRSLL